MGAPATLKYGHSNINAGATATVVKAERGRIYFLYAATLETTPSFLKLYDKAAANVNPAVDIPKYTFLIPSPGSAGGGGFCLDLGDEGLQFDIAISYRVTTGVGPADTGAPAGNSIIINTAITA